MIAKIQSNDKTIRDNVGRYWIWLLIWQKLESLSIESVGTRPEAAATSIYDKATVYVSLEEILDLALESERLKKEIEKITAELSSVTGKSSNRNFMEKAPADVAEKVQDSVQLLKKN